MTAITERRQIVLRTLFFQQLLKFCDHAGIFIRHIPGFAGIICQIVQLPFFAGI